MKARWRQYHRKALCRSHTIAVLLALATPTAGPALAQAWPERPVKMIVPHSAGGAPDVMSRILGKVLGEKLGQPFVVENRVGANGNIGAASVATAAPDGYTLLFTTTGPLSYNKIAYKGSTTFDPAKDFTPIIEVARLPLIIAANSTLPIKTLPELVAYTKANPGKITFASPGNGSMAHMTADLVQTGLSVQMLHVPYRGFAPAMNDLISGQVNICFDLASTYAEQVKAGTLRALAITSPKRWPLLPDVPTLAELGMPNFDATGWIAIVGRPDCLGVNCEGFKAVLRSVEKGNTWVKLSAAYRLGSRERAKALAAELLRTAGPERLFWGSDWPFAAFEDQVTYADTVRDFFDWIPDPAARRKIGGETAFKFYFG